MAEHLLFLTGKLAEPGLCRILGALQGPELSYEVFNIGVSVAALMSAEMIARRLDGPRGADRVIVPGLCAGDLAVPAEKLGVPVLRGPEDMKDLPGFLGRGGVPPDLSRYDIRIFAEIVDAPRLCVEGILERAARYGADGADVIDLGCLPGVPFTMSPGVMMGASVTLRRSSLREVKSTPARPPKLDTVKHPPCISARVSVPCLALRLSSSICAAKSNTPFLFTSRITGTSKPPSVFTATPM